MCIKNLFSLGIAAFLSTGSFAQNSNSKEMDELKAKQAIMFIDNGQTDEAIDMLTTLQKKYPKNADYPYEIAYAWYVKKNYSKTISILEKQVQLPGAYGKMYHLLGNSYDMLKQRDKAIAAYEKGLELFPATGQLYLELGNFSQARKEFYNAIWYYERGIEADPSFPSNYYKAAKLFFNSAEKVWGMLYGEIFLNLERNTKRTEEMSKLLYDTYKSQLRITGDTVIASFSMNIPIDGPSIQRDTAKKIRYGMDIYQPMLIRAAKGEQKIDVNALARIRTKYMQEHFQSDMYERFPNALMDYQFRVSKAGHLEAYHHWILMDDKSAEFKDWVAAHSEQWDKFMTWFRDNAIVLDAKYKFYRKQY